MGQRGRRPTPTAELERRGSRVMFDRKKKPPEPEPKGALGRAPDRLSAIGKRAWNRVRSRLAGMQLGTIADDAVLERYCKLTEWWIAASAKADVSLWAVKKDGDGEVLSFFTNPAVRLCLDLTEKLLRIEREFGLTPAARVGLQTEWQAGAAAPGVHMREDGETYTIEELLPSMKRKA